MLDKSKNINQFDEAVSQKLNETNQPMDDLFGDEMWAEIEATLPPEKKRRNPFWLFLAFGFLFSSFIYIAVKPASTSEVRSSYISSDQSEGAPLVQDLNTYPSETKQNSFLKDESTTKTETNTLLHKSSKTNSIKKSKRSESSNIQSKNIGITGYSRFSFLSNARLYNTTSFLDKTIANNSVTSLEKWRESIELSPLSSSNYFLAKKNLVKDLSPTYEQPIRPLKHSKKVVFQLGTLGTFSHLNNAFAGAVDPFDFYQKPLLGLEVGARYEHYVSSSIFLHGGINVAKLRLNTGHNTLINYNTKDEVSSNELRISNYEGTFATPYGTLTADVILARNSATSVENGEQMKLDIDMIQNINRISTSTGIGYNLSESNNYTLKLMGGVSTGYNFNDKTSIRDLTTSHEGVDNHNSQLSQKLSSLKRWTISGDVGLDLSKKLNANMSVGINAMYRRDINPLFKSGALSTSTSTLSTSLSFQYKLKNN